MANTVLNKWVQYLVLVLMIGCILTSYAAYGASKEANSRTLDIPTAEQIAALVNVDAGNISIEIPEIEVPDMDNAKLNDIFESLFAGNISELEAQAEDDADDEVADVYDDDDDFMDALEDFLEENIADFDSLNYDIDADDYDDVDVEVKVLAVYEDDPEDESLKEVVVTYEFEELEYEKFDNSKDYEVDVNLIATVTYEDGYPDDPEVDLEFVLA